VALQQNTGRIQTTHIVSLPRAARLARHHDGQAQHQPMRAGVQDQPTKAVADCVRKQAESGIDVVTDGEFSKPGFFTYIQERLEGYERGRTRSSFCSSRSSRLFLSTTPNTSSRR